MSAVRPTAARLRELFSYDAATGVLTRRITTSNRCTAGKRAGTLDRTTGYRKVNVDGFMYGEHVVIWCLCTGAWPTGLIDHRNTVRDDNRWGNLRDGSRQLNQENLRHARADNALGVLGVIAAKNGKFKAHIRIAGRQTCLDTFETTEAAHAAYVAAKRQHHAGCTL